MRSAQEPVLVFQKPGPSRPRDLTLAEWAKLTIGVWAFPVQLPYATQHPATFPEELTDRLVRLYSCPGDTIFDPCMGTGTTGVSALRFGRRFIGCDKEEKYCRTAQARLEYFLAQGSLFPSPTPATP